MKVIIIAIALSLVLLIPLSANAQDSEFLFGAVGNQTPMYDSMDAEYLIMMRDTLMFNVYSPLGAWPDMLDLMDDYLKLMPNMYSARNTILTQFQDYTHAHYAIVEAEDRDHQIRFYEPEGMFLDIVDGFVEAPYDPNSPGTETVFLEDLWYKHETGGRVERFSYGLRIRAVDGNTSPGDTLTPDENIGFLKLWTGYWWGGNPRNELKETFYVSSNDFITSGEDILYIEFDPVYPPGLDYIELGTLNQCSLSVDYFKVSNDRGRNLVDDNLYIPEILSHARSNSDHVYFWSLRDEPEFTHWKPFDVIKSALDTCVACSTGNSEYSVWVGQSPKDYIDRADPNFLWVNPYPLYGGQQVNITITPPVGDPDTRSFRHHLTYYTGSSGPDNWWMSEDQGLQFALNGYYIQQVDSALAAADGSKMMLTPQGWGGKYLSTEFERNDTTFSYVAGDGWRWRPPTRSELRCMTFMGMCYPIRGITYWRYDSRESTPGVWVHDYFRGIVDTSLIRTELWDEISEHIGPYLDVINSEYSSLSWDDVYYVDPGESFPTSKWISSINTWSHPDTANPDTGWYHVGQYTEGSAKYIMLVNRACSQGENNPTPAPSVTATIKFNPTALGLGNYVFITDIAESVFRDTTGEWVGVPNTTYSAKLDGTIPFTTVLGPGEGRLFKIAKTDPQ